MLCNTRSKTLHKPLTLPCFLVAILALPSLRSVVKLQVDAFDRASDLLCHHIQQAWRDMDRPAGGFTFKMFACC